MEFLNRKEFVDSFFRSDDLEVNMGSIVQRKRLMSEIDSLLSQGKNKYEAIIELCHKNNIDFKIEEEDNSTFKISTFMDNRAWSHFYLNSDLDSNFSKITGEEIFRMLSTKFNNIISIEKALKKANNNE